MIDYRLLVNRQTAERYSVALLRRSDSINLDVGTVTDRFTETSTVRGVVISKLANYEEDGEYTTQRLQTVRSTRRRPPSVVGPTNIRELRPLQRTLDRDTQRQQL